MQEQKSVQIGESLKYGWGVMKQNIGFFILLLIVYYAVYLAPSLFAEMFADNFLIYFLFNIALMVWSLLLSMGLIHVTLRMFDGQKPTIGELFSQAGLLGQAVLLYILYTLIVLGGFILFVIPGIIWSIKYSQAFYLLVDRKMKATDALKMSGKLMDGVKLEYFGFMIVAGLVAMAGFVALLVGAFATIPTVMMAYVFVYRHLLKATPTNGTPAPAAATPDAGKAMDAPKQ